MTILFQKDWDLYPSAIVHHNTKNQSFIRISALLKEMGVRNHLISLQLHNPELLKVDPFDPQLSLEEMIMIGLECKNNFYYFIREIVRDPNGSIQNPIHYKANRANIAVPWLFFNHITTLVCLMRQSGKSYLANSLMAYLLNIACTNSNINLLTKDNTLRASNLISLKSMIEEMPYYLQQLSKSDIANTEEISIKSLGNYLRGLLPKISPKQALAVGRGHVSAC